MRRKYVEETVCVQYKIELPDTLHIQYPHGDAPAIERKVVLIFRASQSMVAWQDTFSAMEKNQMN